VTPEQCRTARDALGWSRGRLALAAALPSEAVCEFEMRDPCVHQRTGTALRAALEAAGAEFTNGDGPGVRFRAKAMPRN